MKTLRVTALQLPAHDRSDYASRRPRILASVDEAARDSDVLAVPEGTFPAYVLGYEPVDPDAAARDVEALAQIAARRRCAIVAGVALPLERGTANAAIAVDVDGSVAGRADKIFLWHFDRQWFEPGTSLQCVSTAHGRLGMLVCADGRMPGIARALADDGAELLVMPTAWVTSGRDPGALENVQADLLARVRAYENGLPFVAANKCGVERDMVAYCGKSQVIGSDGSIVALAPEHEPATIRGTVAVATAKRYPALRPVAPAAAPAGSARVVICLSADDCSAERLRVLEADLMLAADDGEPADAAASLAAFRVADEELHDPLAGVVARNAGFACIVWDVTKTSSWTVTIARARALELRMYVIVFDRAAGRAYAVDPDGTIVCGTFGAFAYASFVFDPAKTRATLVAPGTDVAEGLRRVQAMVRP